MDHITDKERLLLIEQAGGRGKKGVGKPLLRVEGLGF